MSKTAREIFSSLVEGVLIFTDRSKRAPKPGEYINRFVSEAKREELAKLTVEDVNKTFHTNYIAPTVDVVGRLKQQFDKRILKKS